MCCSVKVHFLLTITAIVITSHHLLLAHFRDINSRLAYFVIWLYLHCRVWLKFKSLGLPVLQVHLQNIWQEEQRVTLQSSRVVEVSAGTSQHLSSRGSVCVLASGAVWVARQHVCFKREKDAIAMVNRSQSFLRSEMLKLSHRNSLQIH